MDVELYSAIMNVALVRIVLGMLFFLILLHWVDSLFRLRKSEVYRKLLSDMYVAGRIRFFAKEDDIDLDKEENQFKKWLKKRRAIDKDLDETIELDLKDKIEEEKVTKVTKDED